MKVPRPRIVVRIIVLTTLLVLAVTRPEAKTAKLLAPTWFGLQQIAPGLYVDRDMSAAEREKVARITDQAREQLRKYYGAVASSPRFFFCATEARFHALGGTTQRGLTIANYACLFPKGGSTPIVAHEWSHAELFTRLGWLNKHRVPQWFDEGVAVTVSEEPSHSEAIYEEAIRTGVAVPTLSELESLRQWNAAAHRYGDAQLNPAHLHVVYATAGHEVRQWFARTGTSGLQRLIAAIREGQAFAACYTPANPVSDPSNR